MHDIGGFDERALLGKIANALDASKGMGKEETRPVESGITVRTVSFERLVQELADDHQLFVMDRKGTPMREQVFQGNPCFLLTDHIPMPKKTFHSLERLGAKKITLGSNDAVRIAMRRVDPPRAGPAIARSVGRHERRSVRGRIGRAGIMRAAI